MTHGAIIAEVGRRVLTNLQELREKIACDGIEKPILLSS